MLPSGPEPSPTRDNLRDQLHVWIAKPERFRDEAALARYRSWLSADECARADRYMAADDRHLFLVAHALLRATLSLYGDLRPEQWQFTSDEQGRPEIAAPQTGETRLRFSLSHTPGLVACAVSERGECGIDVEGIGRVSDPRGLAARYFHRREREEIDRLSDEVVDARFVEYWTLKEAYVKARGLGLALALDGFYFTLGHGGPISIAFEAPASDRSAAWQFDLWRPTADHVLAVAGQRRGGRFHDVLSREMRPVGP